MGPESLVMTTRHWARSAISCRRLVSPERINGVCFIPRARIAEVLTRAQALSAGEEERNRDVAAGMSVVEVANKAYFRKIGG